MVEQIILFFNGLFNVLLFLVLIGSDLREDVDFMHTQCSTSRTYHNFA